MELGRRQWYVHWFFWSLEIWNEFLGRYDSSWHYETHGTNLCHFMRVTFVYGPAVIALHILTVVAGVATVTALPIYLFGGTGYAWSLGTIVGAIVLVVATVYALKFMLTWRVEQQPAIANVEDSEDEQEDAAPVTATAPAGPSFLEVVWTWLVSAKQKICPIIKFRQQAGQEAAT